MSVTSLVSQRQMTLAAGKDALHFSIQARNRDPHEIPTFDASERSEPILYLPPLLSSLPKELEIQEIASEYPPLITSTRLPSIDPTSLSLHKALHSFKPVSADYVRLPYEEAFNWPSFSLPEKEEREWYCVVFRSKRKAGSESAGERYSVAYLEQYTNQVHFTALYEADKLAHQEAIRNGGLIMYWYGIPDPQTGMNMATCIWQSRKHAIAANHRPHHRIAMQLTAQSYEVYTLERYKLRKVAGQTNVYIVPYSESEVEVGW